MLKRKTKTELPAPTDRGTINTIIHFIVDRITLDKNNIVPKGYYYWYDETGKIYQSFIQNSLKLWSDVRLAENNNVVPLLNSNINLEDNILQRMNEFADLQMTAEAGENFGTVLSDWIPEVDEINHLNE